MIFFDSTDAEAARLALSLATEGPNPPKKVDLRSPFASQTLAEFAGQCWAEKLQKEGIDAVRQEAGRLFLALPNGVLFRHGEQEQWMLKYELEYWDRVDPPSPATTERLNSLIFRPLATLASNGDGPNGEPWWSLPEAVGVWGKALAEESFVVLDNFLPPQAVADLAEATKRLKAVMGTGKTDSLLSTKGRGDLVFWGNPEKVPEMGPLVEYLNALVSLAMELPFPAVVARLSKISALADGQFTCFPGQDGEDDARYIRHVDNEDGKNGRLLTCTFYLNEGWEAEVHGGEIRIFEPDQVTVKADVAPVMNRLVIFFSDSTVPHEVRRARRERYAVTTWYLDREAHVIYHAADEEGQ